MQRDLATSLHLPTQATPVLRDEGTAGAPSRARSGIAAATALPPPLAALTTSVPVIPPPPVAQGAAMCRGLTGPARQMCLALHYGISV